MAKLRTSSPARETQRKRISELSKEIDGLREQMGKPSGNYAEKDDLKRLGEAIKEVDKKRLEDYDKIRTDLLKLSNTLKSTAGTGKPPKGKEPPVSETPGAEKATPADKGTFEPYVVQSGDTLDAIVQAYKAKNIKITVAQILKANPGLVPEKLHVGQKIVIPAP